MTSIRFVKPPNDNRIRHVVLLPRRDDVNLLPGEVILMSSSSNTTHITTPKRKVNRIPPINLFITSSSEIDSTVSDTDVGKEKTLRVSTQKRGIVSQENTEQVHDNNVTPSAHKGESIDLPSDLLLETHFKRRKSDLTSRYPQEMHQNFHIPIPKKTECYDDLELHCGFGSPSKCPVMAFLSTYILDPAEGNLSDVMDDELQALPDVSAPRGSFPSPARQDDERNQETKKQDQQQQNVEDTNALTVEEEEEDTSFFGRHRALRRSVSATTFDDVYKVDSFFSSIDDAKFFEVDEIITTKAKRTAVCIKENSEHCNDKDSRQMNRAYKYAWLAKSQSIDNSDTSENQENAKIDTISSEGNKRSGINSSLPDQALKQLSTCKVVDLRAVEIFEFDRMKMRRSALADPEKMVMSQAAREKIEKDVEKRRTSMIRKVSQFFNLRLRLNKEEDLI